MKSPRRGTHDRPAEPTKPLKRPPLAFALEPRMMFDGAAVASAAQAHVTIDAHLNANAVMHGAAAAHEIAHQAPPADSGRDVNSGRHSSSASMQHGDTSVLSQSQTGRNVVFVDARVQDANQLLQGVAPGTQVVY